ncbi:hypothetical protein E2C01_052357 [Portunus trituberculatus]|uniref:CCHC-type domain-containing protein n=1 Tax=Portunus trituberculatus TaxID=210409 RepID=A0A5B7GLP9_PORTR|nr:hypothetical protein [Portunus trituberculatus]
MSRFGPVEFVGDPSVEELKEADVKKDDLIYLATNYNIPFTSSTTKAHLKAMILAHLGEMGDRPHPITPSVNPQETLEIDKVKLEAIKFKLQFELAEREKVRIKFDQEERFRATERLEREREMEHDIQVLQLQQHTPVRQCTPVQGTVQFDIAKNIKLTPNFTLSDSEAFFRKFESTASHFKWPAEHWVWLIKPKLEFKRKVPYPIMVHITDKDETDLLKAAKVADVFSLIHHPGKREKRPPNVVRSDAGSPHNHGKPVGQSQTFERPSLLICRYCRKEGHVVRDCPDPRCRVAKGTTEVPVKPVAATAVASPITQDVFKPYRSTGKVSLGPGLQEHTVRIVRDTASAQSLINKFVLPNIERKQTGERIPLDIVIWCLMMLIWYQGLFPSISLPTEFPIESENRCRRKCTTSWIMVWPSLASCALK